MSTDKNLKIYAEIIKHYKVQMLINMQWAPKIFTKDFYRIERTQALLKLPYQTAETQYKIEVDDFTCSFTDPFFTKKQFDKLIGAKHRYFMFNGPMNCDNINTEVEKILKVA